MKNLSPATVRSRLARADNDYHKLQPAYAAMTGEPLTGDPFTTPRSRMASPPTASVVIPAWNAAATIQGCLRALEDSTFQQRYPQRLQVVVVDDGSVDDTAARVRAHPTGLHLLLVQQPHRGRASAMNTGIAAAEGEVIVSCDADMLPTRGSIEALARRHQLLGEVVLVGFSTDRTPSPGGQPPTGREWARLRARPALLGDNRLSFDWPGWPENMVLASQELRRLGQWRLWMPSGEAWSLPRMVFGCLFSMTRADLLALGGYNPTFAGWGWEDTELAARAIAAGRFVIPVYSASGYHLAHPARSPLKWREADRNRRLYQRLLDQPARPGPPCRPRLTPPIMGAADVGGPAGEPEAPLPPPFLADEASAIRAGRTLAAVGRLEEALHVLCSIDPRGPRGAAPALYTGILLRDADRIPEAVETLQRAAADHTRPGGCAALVHLALAHAAAGEFAAAQQTLASAYQEQPRDRLLRYVLRCPPHRHLRRGHRYARQGNLRVSVRDFEAVLIQDPTHSAARAARAACLEELAAA